MKGRKLNFNDNQEDKENNKIVIINRIPTEEDPRASIIGEKQRKAVENYKKHFRMMKMRLKAFSLAKQHNEQMKKTSIYDQESSNSLEFETKDHKFANIHSTPIQSQAMEATNSNKSTAEFKSKYVEPVIRTKLNEYGPGFTDYFKPHSNKKNDQDEDNLISFRGINQIKIDSINLVSSQNASPRPLVPLDHNLQSFKSPESIHTLRREKIDQEISEEEQKTTRILELNSVKVSQKSGLVFKGQFSVSQTSIEPKAASLNLNKLIDKSTEEDARKEENLLKNNEKQEVVVSS